MERIIKLLLAALLPVCGTAACQKGYEMGTYGYDKAFFDTQGIGTLELRSPDGQARVLLVPAFQGRVMTSTSGGADGPTFGWINHKAVEAGMVNPQFNPFGGEERFWIGPEGGPFSWFFAPGAEQVYANWNVPAFIDSEPFDIASASPTEVVFTKETALTNASGTAFRLGVRRVVRLLDAAAIGQVLGMPLPADIHPVAYCTENTLTNLGTAPWTKETGLPSIWLLGMYPPAPSTVVFIPYEKDFGGRPVNDTYFGTVPADRLIVRDGMAYFRIDGAFRSKIGLPEGSAKGLCGSYDPLAGVLNILRYNTPDGPCDYVNSQWGPQENPFGGDVINAYNDGPTETGALMGPFYEIETSSPGAPLAPGQSLTHTQVTLHLQGPAQALAPVAREVLGADLDTVVKVF